jgi:hypothetical protein
VKIIIRSFFKDTGETVPIELECFIHENGAVYCNNWGVCDPNAHQAFGIWDFLDKRSDIGWEVVYEDIKKLMKDVERNDHEAY